MSLALEPLFTLDAPSAGPPQAIDASLVVFTTGAGGTLSGPRVRGTIVPPSGDWLRPMPGGSMRIDARVSVVTDDGAAIHVRYGGVATIAPADFARMRRGETLGPDEMSFVITPVFQTSDERYLWLTRVQAIGRAIALRGGPEGFVRYEVFAAHGGGIADQQSP